MACMRNNISATVLPSGFHPDEYSLPAFPLSESNKAFQASLCHHLQRRRNIDPGTLEIGPRLPGIADPQATAVKFLYSPPRPYGGRAETVSKLVPIARPSWCRAETRYRTVSPLSRNRLVLIVHKARRAILP